MILYLLVSTCLFGTPLDDFRSCEAQLKEKPYFQGFAEVDDCLDNRGCFNDKEMYKSISCVSHDSFTKTLDLCIATMKQRYVAYEKWLTLRPAELGQQFNLFSYALRVPSETTVIFKGDLHGDAHSLVAFINYLAQHNYTSPDNPFKLVNDSQYLVFLGDYVDRGIFGVEVLYLLMQLQIHNPDRVILVRGNHEDPSIQSQYGFAGEFIGKFGRQKSTFQKLEQFYNLMPLVLFVGSGGNYIQCCHGGLEPGYNPQILFASDKAFESIPILNRKAFFKGSSYVYRNGLGIKAFAHEAEKFSPKSLTVPYPLGFAWHDFEVNPHGISDYYIGRGYSFNKDVTEEYFKQASTDEHRLVSIIRAHQHTPDDKDPLMKLMLRSHGCAVLWNKRDYTRHNKLEPHTVHTLLLSPDSLYGLPSSTFRGFDYDTTLFLTTGTNLADWSMNVINNRLFNHESHPQA